MQAKLAASKPKGYKLQGQNCSINSSKTEALGGGKGIKYRILGMRAILFV